MGFFSKIAGAALMITDPAGGIAGLTGQTAAAGTALSIAEQRAARIEARQISAQAREDALRLFPAAQQNLQQGFQGALDVFGQALPAQTQVFQQGISGAQQALLSGLPQFQNAILGGQIDFSALQPQQFQQPDLSFFQQQLPQQQSIDQALGLNEFAPTEPSNLENINLFGRGKGGDLPSILGGIRRQIP